jgi:hypothetical protein
VKERIKRAPAASDWGGRVLFRISTIAEAGSQEGHRLSQEGIEIV